MKKSFWLLSAAFVLSGCKLVPSTSPAQAVAMDEARLCQLSGAYYELGRTMDFNVVTSELKERNSRGVNRMSIDQCTTLAMVEIHHRERINADAQTWGQAFQNAGESFSRQSQNAPVNCTTSRTSSTTSSTNCN